MSIKAPLWFLERSYEVSRAGTPLAPLAERALELGLLKVDLTRGQIFQAVGAVQRFYQRYPLHIATVRAASPLQPYKLVDQVLADWLVFMVASDGPYERADFGYDYTTLKNYLTPKYGGHRTGGGGGDNELEIALRLIAEFL